ncbi:MAG: peroxiredoxin family protein [Acidobacteriota bacterium]
MLKNKPLIPIILLLLVVALFSLSGFGKIKGQSSSSPAPDFALPDLEGKTVKLSDFKGKVIIIDFWATWCPPCVKEIPHFIELYEQYKENGFQMIGIAIQSGSATNVKQFVEEHGINYPILMGNKEITREYGGINAIPTTFVIDRQGRIVQKYIGYRDKEVFENQLKALF